MLNDYNDGGPYQWSIQLAFDGTTGTIDCDCGSATPAAPALVYDTWTEVRAEIDLDADSVSIFYNGQSIASYLWSEGALGGSVYSTLHIEGLDLYPDPASSPSPIYWDDFSLVASDALGTNYCVSTPNSTGSATIASASGSVSVAANDLVLEAAPTPQQPGIFFYGANQVQLAFGNGFRCVGGQLFRYPVSFGTGGSFSYAVDYTSPPSAAGQITSGSTWNFQLWYRDPAAGGAFFNLSDGYSIVFAP